MHRRRFIGLLPALAAPSVRAARLSSSSSSPWPLLERGGCIVLIRHAATLPGIGDPPGFSLAQCSTQRNLSRAGRFDAARIGTAFRKHAVRISAVLSSRWCRCIDTAQLAFGRVQRVVMLDSMFVDDAAARQAKLAAVRSYVTSLKGHGNVVMVTHDVNIRALVGRYAEPGTLIIASRGAGGTLAVEMAIPIAALDA